MNDKIRRLTSVKYGPRLIEEIPFIKELWDSIPLASLGRQFHNLAPV